MNLSATEIERLKELAALAYCAQSFAYPADWEPKHVNVQEVLEAKPDDYLKKLREGGQNR